MNMPIKQHAETLGPPIDNHGRAITYLRLAITDRCNLRCQYCMSEKGVTFIPHEEILTLEELERLVRIFVGLGLTKLRITGGEPFARRGSFEFIKRIATESGIKSFFLTTNGVATAPYLKDLKELGLAGINLSLDTLDAIRFLSITKRNSFEAVLDTFYTILDLGIPLKVNSVILPETTDKEIETMASLAQKWPITLRFIELMPFSGTDSSSPENFTNSSLNDRLISLFEGINPVVSDEPSTARVFNIPGFSGKLGVIEGYSRLFCSQCNKVRVTPVGMMKTCLYDNGVLDLKAMLRDGRSDSEIQNSIIGVIRQREVNGHAAEAKAARNSEPSMSSIGG